MIFKRLSIETIKTLPNYEQILKDQLFYITNIHIDNIFVSCR